MWDFTAFAGADHWEFTVDVSEKMKSVCGTSGLAGADRWELTVDTTEEMKSVWDMVDIDKAIGPCVLLQ